MEQNNFYVYVYLDPRKPGNYIYEDLNFDHEPFYVGKGKGNRIIQGLTNLRSHGKYKINKLEKIRESNLEIIHFKLVENLEEKTAFEIEKEIIKKIGRKIENGPLTNINEGGSGGDQYTNNPNKEQITKKWKETRNKTIEFNKLNGIKMEYSKERVQKRLDTMNKKREEGVEYKWNLSEKSKKNISEKNKGLKRTDECKQKIRECNLGKIRSEESKLKQSITCKETLSKIKDKLKDNKVGMKNSNAKKYIIKINETSEIKEFFGYKSILSFYNDLTESSYKDHSLFHYKLRNNLIKELTLVDTILINIKKLV